VRKVILNEENKYNLTITHIMVTDFEYPDSGIAFHGEILVAGKVRVNWQ